MGVSGKWFKTLVGLRKSEKSKHLERDESKTVGAGRFWHRRKHSVEIEGVDLEDEPALNMGPPVDVDNQSCSTTTPGLPTGKTHVEISAQTEQITKEEWAVTRIQTAFRALLARRALRALKAVVRLQALVRGHAVRKQAAITLRCMQALVRVQARVRARRVRMALESQFAQGKNPQLTHEMRVRDIEGGWCHSIGSVEDIQTKLQKRQEAAAKRERAMAYALAHQWQAGSRQQVAPAGFEPDRNNWGWNWLERWMAVRPWENRFVDINLKDGVVVHERGSGEAYKNGTKTKLKSNGRMSTPNLNASNQKMAASLADGTGSSSNRSSSNPASSTTSSRKVKPKKSPEEPVEEANSKPSGIMSRSYSYSKERLVPQESEVQRRASLPSSGGGAQTTRRTSNQTAANKMRNAHKITRIGGRQGSNPVDMANQEVQVQT